MQSANEKLLNFQIIQQVRWIRHQNSVIRQLNPLYLDTSRELRELILDISPSVRMSRAQIIDLRKQVLRILATYKSLVDPVISKAFADVAKLSADLELQIFERLTKTELYGTSALNVEKRAKRETFNGSNFNHWRNQHYDNDIKRTWRGILSGIASDESPRDLSNRVVGTKRRGFLDGMRGVTKRGLDAFTRTALGHAQEQGKQEIWERNQKIINLVQWISVLDNRTTPYCRRTHNAVGPVAPIDAEKFKPPKGYRAIRPIMQRPPAHPQCRSSVVAFLSDAQKAGLDSSKLSNMDGSLPTVPSYPQWLRQQTAATQKEILGAKRYALYKKAGVTPDRFYNDASRIIPLSTLRKRMPEHFKTAGI